MESDSDGVFPESEAPLQNGDADGVSSPDQIPTGVEPLFGFDPPPPRKWAVEDLIPKDFLSIIVGDGGTGKSFLALHLGLCIATDRNFLGKDVRQGRVLYLDYELNLFETQRRELKVAAGMELDLHGPAVENNFFYFSPESPLGTTEHEKETVGVINEVQPDFLILDSLTEAAAGDMKDHMDFNKVAREIKKWPTTLAIDHVSHTTAKSGSHKARPFGSVFKRNVARSTLTLSEKEDGLRLLQQDKSNFSEGDTQIIYEMDFSENTVSFERISMQDERTDVIVSDLPTHEVTLTAIKRIYDETGNPVSKDEVLDWREKRDEGIGLGAIRNQFTKLKRLGKIQSQYGEGAIPTEETSKSCEG